MAWTSPRTWVAGEKPTAATLNTHIRDNFKALGDAWTAYGSGASWTASSVNPSLGNGTWDGRYIQAGKLVVFQITITMGSTTTYGTGSYLIALPVSEVAARWAFNGVARDTSAVNTYPILGERGAAGSLTIKTWPTTAGNPLSTVTATAPFTWANTDTLSLWGYYEAS